jgi:hypothetical protein
MLIGIGTCQPINTSTCQLARKSMMVRANYVIKLFTHIPHIKVGPELKTPAFAKASAGKQNLKLKHL